MIRIPCKFMLLIVSSVFMMIASIPAISIETNNDKGINKAKEKSQPYNGISGLEVARIKLNDSIVNYKNGDLAAARHDLEIATEWLNKASQISKTEKSRETSRQLAIEIEAFKQQLKKSSAENENTLSHFLHRATAIIGREVDHLIQSYDELATSEKTLKHLLDAKMHLYTAERDLLVSHDYKDSVHELDRVIKYLDKANRVAVNQIKIKINALSKKVHLIKERAKQNPEAWQINHEIVLLKQAKESLTKAKGMVSPQTKKRIESIEADIQVLHKDIEKNNIKNDYESCMAILREIINEL